MKAIPLATPSVTTGPAAALNALLPSGVDQEVS